MKYIHFLMILVASAVVVNFSACSDSDEVGSPIEIYDDYTLPQSGASDEANSRIMQYYQKYGSYVLYNYTSKDAFWVPNTGAANNNGSYVATLGKPTDVDAMLDYIEDIWLKYFTDDFLKKGGMPYRVFLADSLYYVRDFGGGYIRKSMLNYQINGNSIIIANMGKVKTMDAATKKANKIELFNALWSYYQAQGLITLPQEFFEVSDYTTKPHMTSTTTSWGETSYEYTEEDLAALRNRGFLPKYSQYGWSMYNEIYYISYGSDYWDVSYGFPTESQRKNADYQYYMSQILNATDEEVAAFLAYPTVAKKWNIILNYYKDNYNIDLRAIATN